MADLMDVGAVEWWPLERVLPYARNAKTHDEAGVAQLAGMIKEFGWTYPILVDEEGVILAGHKRRRACERLGLEKAPVLVKKGLTAHQKQAYRIADNKTTENSPWDEGLLKIELDELKAAGTDLGLTAFSVEELKTLWGVEEEPPPDPGPQVDRAEELRKKWQVEAGQMWQLGAHRLICGDCTDAAVVARVMGGERAALCVTDPPYGVGYADKNKFLNSISRGNRIQTHIEGDHSTKEETQELWKSAFQQMNEVLSPGAVVYCFMPQGGDQMMMMMMMMGAGIEPRHELIWLKNNHVLGRVDYAYKHEPILYAWKAGGHKFYGDFQTSILEFPKPQKSGLHPTTKPVELIEMLVSNSSLTGETVYEPFSGSGTTLIACEQLGRRCRAVEISPGYVAVALERWATATGKTPELVEEKAPTIAGAEG
jgi:DNA modification methylase